MVYVFPGLCWECQDRVAKISCWCPEGCSYFVFCSFITNEGIHNTVSKLSSKAKRSLAGLGWGVQWCLLYSIGQILTASLLLHTVTYMHEVPTKSWALLFKSIKVYKGLIANTLSNDSLAVTYLILYSYPDHYTIFFVLQFVLRVRYQLPCMHINAFFCQFVPSWRKNFFTVLWLTCSNRLAYKPRMK